MIYVDADACPVKAEVEQVATHHKVGVKLVCNGGIRPSTNPLVELVVVLSNRGAAYLCHRRCDRPSQSGVHIVATGAHRGLSRNGYPDLEGKPVVSLWHLFGA